MASDQSPDSSYRTPLALVTEDEARFVIVGRIAGVFWSAVITYRNTRVRLISVRRSRVEEVALYESQDF